MNRFVIPHIIGLSLICSALFAQPQAPEVYYQHKIFQIGLVPGVSSNGLNSGYYTNSMSFNVLSGYSGGSSILEVGILSNHNREFTTGIQIGGLFNITGANRFADFKSQPKFRVEKENPAHLKGFQVAGIGNIVRGTGAGFQASSLLNSVALDFTGFQVALGLNYVRETVKGFQLALISNISGEHVAGVQTSLLFNLAGDNLFGIQLGAVNKTDDIYGPKSWVEASSGLQIGLVNFAREMDGYQIGLINFAGKAKGLQLGLINFSPANEGWPIGLLNVNSLRGHLQFTTNDVFYLNYSLATGNKNVQNTVEFGHDSFDTKNSKWGLTYLVGLRKDVVRDYMIVRSFKTDLGATWMKNNYMETSNHSFLLSWKLNSSFRIIPNKKYDYFITIGPNFYFHFSKKDETISHLGYTLIHSKSDKLHFKAWIGYQASISVF